MEVPGSFDSDAIRNEKAKLLQAVRAYSPAEVERYVVRGQYGPKLNEKGEVVKARLPPGKGRQPRIENRDLRRRAIPHRQLALGRRSRSICAQAKRSGSAAPKSLSSSRKRRRSSSAARPSTASEPTASIFHIQPISGHRNAVQCQDPWTDCCNFNPSTCASATAKPLKHRATPVTKSWSTPARTATPRFSRAAILSKRPGKLPSRCSITGRPRQHDFPNYARGSWGPKAASDLINRDGRRWFEVITEDVLKKMPLFKDGDPALPIAGPALAAPEARHGRRNDHQEGRNGTRNVRSRPRRSRSAWTMPVT